MNYYVLFIYFVIIIKFLFLIFSVLEKLLQHDKNKSFEKIKFQNEIEKYKNFTKIVFDILMALLLIYLFNPHYDFDNSLITHEVKILLFIYGILLLFQFVNNDLYDNVINVL